MVTGVLNMNAFHWTHHSATLSILPSYTLITVGRHTCGHASPHPSVSLSRGGRYARRRVHMSAGALHPVRTYPVRIPHARGVSLAAVCRPHGPHM
jgi:hypothetical protein